jgi:iron(III) transport system permease protein
MLGSFAVALVLGLPDRYYVVTTAIYQLVQQYPPKIPLAAAMGTSLFVVMFVDAVHLPPHHLGRQLRDHHRQGVPPARQRRRPAAATCCSRSACSICFCSVVLPLLTLFYASIQQDLDRVSALSNFTTEHFYKAFTMNAATTRSATACGLRCGPRRSASR